MSAAPEKDPGLEGEEDEVPSAPNESAPGHHPDERDVPREDAESEQSFPASDPPANY